MEKAVMVEGERDSKEIAVLKAKLEGFREFVESKFDQVEAHLNRLEQSVEKLANRAVPQSRCEGASKAIERSHQRLDNHGKIITQYQQVSRILWGIISAILIAVLVAVATGKATIVWQ
jgi:hypothetical protein